MGYVYLLIEVDKDGYERHKIGETKNNPSIRVSQLQTGNSNKISLLKHYPSENYKKIERMLHIKYKNQKTETKNEWFLLTDEQVMSFMDICAEMDKTVIFLKENNHFYN